MQASGHQPQTFKLPASCWGHRLHYNEPSGAGCSGLLPLGGWDMWDSNIVAVPALPTHPTGREPLLRGRQWEPITALGEPMVALGATRSLNSSTCSPKRKTCWPRTMANISSRAAGQCGASSPRAGSQCPRTWWWYWSAAQSLAQQPHRRVSHTVVFPAELSAPPSAPAQVRQQMCELL